MANLIFLDTEFTDFAIQKLISVGMVDTAGNEFYVELSGWDERDCSMFVLDEVLPSLRGDRTSLLEAGAQLLNWLDRHHADAPSIILVDSEYDLGLFSKMPRQEAVPDAGRQAVGDQRRLRRLPRGLVQQAIPVATPPRSERRVGFPRLVPLEKTMRGRWFSGGSTGLPVLLAAPERHGPGSP